MRYVLEPTIRHLHQFIAQREKLVLILRGASSDSLALIKTLEGLDDPHSSDLFWTSTDPFQGAKSYATSVVAAFSVRHTMIKMTMGKKGLAPWPEIPAPILSEATDPVERVRQLAAFSRDLLPIPMGGNTVWILYPMTIADPFGYAAFMKSVLAHEFPNPWCHHLRFIVREDPEVPQLSALIGKSSSVDIHTPDFGPEAVARSLQREVDDPALSMEERLNSLLVMAGADVADSRFQESLQKYSLLLEYYLPRNNHTMIAIALNGMGEVYVRLEDHGRANEAFQAALIPASLGENPPIQVFLNASMNLAMLRMSQSDWPQAAGYWEVVRDAAVLTRDPSTKVRAYDQLGYCHYKLGDLAQAEQDWLSGAELAAAVEDEALFRTLMERRRALYVETQQMGKLHEINQLLEAMA